MALGIQQIPAGELHQRLSVGAGRTRVADFGDVQPVVGIGGGFFQCKGLGLFAVGELNTGLGIQHRPIFAVV